jgi:transcriptional regulator with XRE-family HTH domain
MKKRDYALGARIKTALKAAGYKTAKEFCEQHSIHYLTFSQHIQGRRKPTPEFLKLYSKLFRVNLDWLETGEGDPLSTGRTSQSQKKQHEAMLKKEFTKLISLSRSSEISVDLLSLLLEKVLPLIKKYKINEKKASGLIATMYTEITKTTNDKKLQLSMVPAFIKTYTKILDN